MMTQERNRKQWRAFVFPDERASIVLKLIFSPYILNLEKPRIYRACPSSNLIARVKWHIRSSIGKKKRCRVSREEFRNGNVRDQPQCSP
jgi:hypothetical protein